MHSLENLVLETIFTILITALQAATGFIFVDHSPDCSVHTAVIELFVVQLSEEGEQDLDTSYRVDGAVDGVGNNGLHILWARYGLLMHVKYCTVST